MDRWYFLKVKFIYIVSENELDTRQLHEELKSVHLFIILYSGREL